VRVVSLVPSLTEAVAVLGRADALVGVTAWCERGAPASATVVGGTKNPDVARITALRPDLVLANSEENRAEDLAALRAAGVTVHETFPRTVTDVGPMLRGLGQALDATSAAEAAAADVEGATAGALAAAPRTPVAVCTLIWRKPWMAVGPDTFVDDLLRHCGFANVLAGWEERYPRLDPSLVLRPEAVLLPSEPYAFTQADLPAVEDLLGEVAHRFVDGRLLTWHGPSTAQALRVFTALAVELRAALGGR
jgi:ABC-type Fe3+-hydroxamate transport system substrate-binding protein